MALNAHINKKAQTKTLVKEERYKPKARNYNKSRKLSAKTQQNSKQSMKPKGSSLKTINKGKIQQGELKESIINISYYEGDNYKHKVIHLVQIFKFIKGYQWTM